MTATASRDAARELQAPAASWAERVLPALPLVSTYLLVFTFWAWAGVGHRAPWLFSDEVEYTQLSRAIWETGEPARRGEPYDAISIFTYLLAPFWSIAQTTTAYTAIKYAGAAVMASAMLPAYLLARTLVPRGFALFAAVGTGVLPAVAYSRLIVTEVVAYPFAALAFYLMARAFATFRPAWLVAAGAAAIVAPEVRSQLVILQGVFLGGLLVALWLSDPARRIRRGWHPAMWAASLAVGAALVALAHVQLKQREELYYLATTLPDRFADFTIWSAGAFVIGIGLVPTVLALASLWRPRDVALPAYRGFVAVFLPAIALFVLYTAVKSVFISTQFASVISERNLIYLAPLVFVGAALALDRPLLHVPALAGATLLVAYLAFTTPYELDRYPYSDAPGLAVLAELNRTFEMDDAAVRRTLVWIVVGTLLVAAFAGLARRGRAAAVARPVLGCLAVLVLAWNVVGARSFGDGINGLSERLRASVPEPPDWIDRATGGASTFYLGQGIADPNAILETEFWNRSLTMVGSLDGSAPGPGPTLTPVPSRADGSVENDPRTEYVLLDTPWIDPFGTLVERTGDWRLYRIGGRLRLKESVTGVYPDGWIGSSASYLRFGTGERGTLTVSVSREAWGGEDKPGRVTVRVGRLVPAPLETIRNPCAGGVCVDRQPRIGRLLATRSWTAHAGKSKSFDIPVTTPFKVEVTVDPTFSPFDYGVGDNRQLGVQAGFAFAPGK